MDETTLEMLVNYGEETKLEYKREVTVMNKTDREARAEMVLDVLAMANAHDETTGHILIGVDDEESGPARLVDARGLNLDDARLHDFLDELIAPPVKFSFHYRETNGKAVGIIEIPFSDSRFHVV